MTQKTVGKEKVNALIKSCYAIGIFEKDITYKTILGSGKGGQKQNKTKNCVQIHHLPSDIIIKCQSSRSLTLNKYYALHQLYEKIAAQQGILTKKVKTNLKIAKQKKRRKRRQNKEDSK